MEEYRTSSNKGEIKVTIKTLRSLYRTAYIIGVAFIIASIALMLPGGRNINPASAQTGWFVTLSCDGFDLDAPEHPAVNVRIQARAPGDTNWGYQQSLALDAGGPTTVSHVFDPAPPPGSEVLIRVFAVSDNANLFNFKDYLPCGAETPTNTPVTPTNTPVTPTDTPTNTPVTPTDTPVDTPTSTATITIPTITNTPTDTNTPTVTPTGTLPTNTPTFTPTFTPTGTLPTITPSVTPTFTPTGSSTATSTATPQTSISTPTPRQPRSTNTPQSGIPSPAPQGTPGVLIPETGLDLNAQFNFMQRSLLNLGLGFLGIGLVLQGMAFSTGRKEE